LNTTKANGSEDYIMYILVMKYLDVSTVIWDGLSLHRMCN